MTGWWWWWGDACGGDGVGKKYVCDAVVLSGVDYGSGGVDIKKTSRWFWFSSAVMVVIVVMAVA